jgi:hypothetical protein
MATALIVLALTSLPPVDTKGKKIETSVLFLEQACHGYFQGYSERESELHYN